jgi:DinB superfamily
VPRCHAAASLRDEIRAALPDLGRLSEAESGTPRSTGHWSPKQIIGHLIDSAFNNHGRFVRAQSMDDLVFPGYAQDAWVRVQRYEARPWRELVQLWEQVNMHLAWVMESAPEPERSRARRPHNLHQIGFQPVPAGEPATLDQLMIDYVAHLRHHLRQIRECAPR